MAMQTGGGTARDRIMARARALDDEEKKKQQAQQPQQTRQSARVQVPMRYRQTAQEPGQEATQQPQTTARDRIQARARAMGQQRAMSGLGDLTVEEYQYALKQAEAASPKRDENPGFFSRVGKWLVGKTEKTPEEIRDYMNRYLPDDICVQEAKLAADRFHARYRAVGKLYTYTCYVGETKPVFNRKYVTVLDGKPDVEKMRKAAEFLVGEHDFRSFCANPQMKKSTVRIVDSIEIQQKKDLLYLNFHGTGFLQNMVRILTGTLLEVGFGKRSVASVKEVLEAKDRKLAGYTAPPQGLCLMRVDY